MFGDFSVYNVIAAPVTAVPLSFDGMEPLKYTKWGKPQTAKHGDWLIAEQDGQSAYTCAADVFAATYQPVAGQPGRYQKFGTVEAAEATEPGTVQTLEGSTDYVAGDFVLRGPSGDMWAMGATKFHARYAAT